MSKNAEALYPFWEYVFILTGRRCFSFVLLLLLWLHVTKMILGKYILATGTTLSQTTVMTFGVFFIPFEYFIALGALDKVLANRKCIAHGLFMPIKTCLALEQTLTIIGTNPSHHGTVRKTREDART